MLQVGGGHTSTQRVTIIAVDEGGCSHWEILGACLELDSALRGAPHTRGPGSRPGTTRAGGPTAMLHSGAAAAGMGSSLMHLHLQALLALCKQLRARL